MTKASAERTGMRQIVCGLLLVAVVAVDPGLPRVAAQPAIVMFGASVRPRGGETQQQAVEDLETTIGRSLAGVRVFKHWGDPFPTDYDRWLRDSGHTLFLSISPPFVNGEPVPWIDIANAPPGSQLYDQMVGWANRVKRFHAPIYFIFNHEPDTANRQVMGSPADFVAAWQKVVTVFRDQGVSNAQFLWTLTAYTFARTDALAAAAWYPGDSYVDAIGADGYNFFGCRPETAGQWRSFATIFDPVRVFGQQHTSEPLMIPEWGSIEDPGIPGRKGGWISFAQATLESPGWEQFKAVLYYHSQSSSPPICDFWADTSQSSLTAFRAMGLDPYFYTGSPPVITSFSPTGGPAGTSVTILGDNFSHVLSVDFNGTPASFTVDSITRITATVPAIATTGPIRVTTDFGAATTGASFTVRFPPTISSIDPAIGAVGRSITILGTNFVQVTSVRFNSASAGFVTNSPTNLTATVPRGATTGPVSVTTADGTATFTADFTVVHPRHVSLQLHRAPFVTGKVSVRDGYWLCAAQAIVRIQRRVSGHWRTLAATRTNGLGAYQAQIRNRAGRYRALLRKTSLRTGDVCGPARSRVRNS